MSVLHQQSYGAIKSLNYKHLVQLLHKLSRSMGKWKQKQSERWYPFTVRPCSPHWDTVPPQTLLRPTLLERTHPVTFLTDRCFCFATLEQICALIELSRSNIRTRLSWCVLEQHNQQRNKNCALLGHCAASSGNSLPMFRDNIPVPIHESIIGLLTHEPIGCPESSVKNYHYLLRNDPEQRSSRLFSGGSLKSRNRDINS